MEYLLLPRSEGTVRRVRRLRKALYGLRKPPKYWQQFFVAKVAELGWKRSLVDPQFFYHPETGSLMVAHVDDILITADKEILDDLCKAMGEKSLL